jgi:hypothetical protein
MISWPPLYGTGGHAIAEMDFVLFRQARFSTRCGQRKFNFGEHHFHAL